MYTQLRPEERVVIYSMKLRALATKLHGLAHSVVCEDHD